MSTSTIRCGKASGGSRFDLRKLGVQDEGDRLLRSGCRRHPPERVLTLPGIKLSLKLPTSADLKGCSSAYCSHTARVRPAPQRSAAASARHELAEPTLTRHSMT